MSCWPSLAVRHRVREHWPGLAFQTYRITEAIPEAACRENVPHSCFVSARGGVSPCVMTNLGLGQEAEETDRFQGEDHPIEPLTFGNVRERPLKEIWRSPPARAFRRAIQQRIYTSHSSPASWASNGLLMRPSWRWETWV